VSTAAAGAGRDPVPTRPRSRLIRAVLAVPLALLAAAAAWLLARQGIRTDEFPPFIAGAASTTITRYSGPWLTAAAGAALLSALLALSAVVDLIRWSRPVGARASGGERVQAVDRVEPVDADEVVLRVDTGDRGEELAR